MSRTIEYALAGFHGGAPPSAGVVPGVPAPVTGEKEKFPRRAADRAGGARLASAARGATPPGATVLR